MNRYIETYEDFVYKDDYGKYVFTKLMSDRNIMASLYLFMTELVNSDMIQLGSQSTIIVSGTYPFMNWRRSMYNQIKSKHSRKIIDHQMLLNYVMVDRSIKIDEYHLSRKFNEWVNMCMSKTDDLDSAVNVADNIKFMHNRTTSESDLINIIVAMYGESRVRVGIPDGDYIRSIRELNEYVYKDIDPETMIPKKVINESAYYLNLLLKSKFNVEDLDDGDEGEEQETDY